MSTPKYPVTGCYVGGLTYQHNFPPAPFNPLYDPKASSRWKTAVKMCWERVGFSALPQSERAAAIAEQYDALTTQHNNVGKED